MPEPLMRLEFPGQSDPEVGETLAILDQEVSASAEDRAGCTRAHRQWLHGWQQSGHLAA